MSRITALHGNLASSLLGTSHLGAPWAAPTDINFYLPAAKIPADLAPFLMKGSIKRDPNQNEITYFDSTGKPMPVQAFLYAASNQSPTVLDTELALARWRQKAAAGTSTNTQAVMEAKAKAGIAHTARVRALQAQKGYWEGKISREKQDAFMASTGPSPMVMAAAAVAAFALLG